MYVRDHVAVQCTLVQRSAVLGVRIRRTHVKLDEARFELLLHHKDVPVPTLTLGLLPSAY